jgi:hypothetical protein
MPGITLIFSAFDRNLVFSLGAEVAKDDPDEKEIVVVESQADMTIRQVGFTRNDEEEDEDDAYRSSDSGNHVVGRSPGGSLR